MREEREKALDESLIYIVWEWERERERERESKVASFKNFEGILLSFLC